MKKEKPDQTLQLIAIKTKDKVFVSDNVSNSGYFSSKLSSYLFDGELLTKTYKSDWFTLRQIPSKIEREVPPQKVNIRYELREGFPESELTPKIIEKSYIDEDSPYYEVQGLYERKWDETDAGLEELEFELNIIEERDRFEFTQEKYPVKYNFLNILNIHPILLSTTPCTLSRKDSYDIIRRYVKEKIDPRYAYISSDYDFHFEVKKKVKLHEPFKYEVDVNSGTRRRPKIETRYRHNREVSVIEFAEDPSRYKGSTYSPTFNGDNAEDLKNKVEAYLEELLEEINRPYVDCKHCKGAGVVLEGVNQ